MKKLLASLGILVVAMSTIALAHDPTGVPHQMWNMNGDWDLTYIYSGLNYNHLMSVVDYAALDPVIDTDESSGQFSGTGYYCPNPAVTWDIVTGKLDLDDSVNFEILYTGANAGYSLVFNGKMVEDSHGLGMAGDAAGSGQVGTFTAKTACVSIPDGTLTYSSTHWYLKDDIEGNEFLPIEQDEYGYDYYRHYFEGYYVNIYFGGWGYPAYTGDDTTYFEAYPDMEIIVDGISIWPYRKTVIKMEWNDAWLSNKDCGEDGTSALNSPDGLIDRYYGFDSYQGSGAWETNEVENIFEDKDCEIHNYMEIMAVPEGAVNVEGVWFTEDGEHIGAALWGSFAVVFQDNLNTCKTKKNRPLAAGPGV